MNELQLHQIWINLSNMIWSEKKKSVPKDLKISKTHTTAMLTKLTSLRRYSSYNTINPFKVHNLMVFGTFRHV